LLEEVVHVAIRQLAKAHGLQVAVQAQAQRLARDQVDVRAALLHGQLQERVDAVHALALNSPFTMLSSSGRVRNGAKPHLSSAFKNASSGSTSPARTSDSSDWSMSCMPRRLPVVIAPAIWNDLPSRIICCTASVTTSTS